MYTHVWHLIRVAKFQNLLGKDDENIKTIKDLKFQLETLKTAYSHDVDKLQVDVNKLRNEVDKLNVCSWSALSINVTNIRNHRDTRVRLFA